MLAIIRLLVKFGSQFVSESLAIFNRVYRLPFGRIEEATFALHGKFPVYDTADVYSASSAFLLVCVQHNVAVAPQQGAFAEAATPEEHNYQSLYLVVGRGNCWFWHIVRPHLCHAFLPACGTF